MGTRGCINYNPALALRQLGYPMMGPPSEDVITPFVLYYMETKCTVALQKVRNAWDKVIRKGKELGVRSCGVKESYRLWVKNRVQEVKLPFKVSAPPMVDRASTSVPIENEEVKEIKAKLVEVEEEKKKMEIELRKTRQAYAALERESSKKNHTLEGANKRLKTEQDYMHKTKECLRAANKELGLRRQERDRALAENQQLKEMLKNNMIARKDALKQVDNMRQQMEAVVAKCEEKIKKERQHMEEVVTKYQVAIEDEQANAQELMEQVTQQEHIIQAWMIHFSNLAGLANAAIADVPRHLRTAELMINPLSTPIEICDFIEYCKGLIGQMKRMASGGE